MRELLAGVLEDEGHRVIAAARGEEAVEAAAREALDLVVLDVRMEGLDGLEALALMREHLHGAATLVVTGYACEADSVRALRLGVSDYLHKPFELERFLERVDRLLGETRRRRLREGREERLRALSRWGLVVLARALEGRTLPPGAAQTLERASALAGRLASGAGLESPEAEEIEAGALLLAAHRYFGAAGPEIGDTSPPAAAQAATEAAGLAARIADLAVASAEGEADPAARWPGRFDPLLLEGLEAARAGAPVPPPRGRALVSLGRALLQAGDQANARRAYCQAAATGTPREAVEAWLGLAHAERAADQRERIPASVRSALEAARAVGPAETGRAALEGGLVLLRAGCPEARSVLEEACASLQRLGLEPAASRARLARAALGPAGDEEWRAPLEILLRPEHEAERQEDLPWLVPALLEGPGHADLQRSLARLVRESPRELARALEGGALSPEARRQAAGLLACAGGSVPPPLLERLAADPDPAVREPAEAALRGRSAAPARPSLRIRSLGPLEVRVGHQPLEERAWRSSRVKHLFAYLAIQPRPVSEDRILEEFWPDDAECGRKGLYWATSAIRRTLRGWGPQGEEAVVRLRGHLGLNPDLPCWHDLAELERARATPPGPGRPAAARRVVELARGPFLDGCYMDWALAVRTRVEGQVREALAELHQHYHERAMPGEALECALRLQDLDPLCQEACRRVMQSQLALGRPAEAVRRFEAHRRVLARELEMEPSLELLELYHRARLGLT